MLKGSNFSGEGNKVTDKRVNKNIDFNLLLFLLLVRRLQTPKTIKIFMVQSSIYNETGSLKPEDRTVKNSLKRRFLLKQKP